jgi:iron-sulfur cluster repair protein YtfE (RIC family)
MEHPLIHDIDSLTVDQVQGRISDLTKKLAWARQSNNLHLANQISMALETFQNRYRQQMDEIYAKSSQKGQDFSDRIDIS